MRTRGADASPPNITLGWIPGSGYHAPDLFTAKRMAGVSDRDRKRSHNRDGRSHGWCLFRSRHRVLLGRAFHANFSKGRAGGSNRIQTWCWNQQCTVMRSCKKGCHVTLRAATAAALPRRRSGGAVLCGLMRLPTSRTLRRWLRAFRAWHLPPLPALNAWVSKAVAGWLQPSR